MASTVICTAAAKLSRRRTWHNSCARIACSWSGDKRSKMPSGSINTGLKIPKTPGSTGTEEDIAFKGTSNGNGDAARTAARMLRHRTNHEKATTAKPQNQIPSKISGTRLPIEETIKSGAEAERANGWLICSIARGKGDCAMEGAVRH